MNEKWNEWKMKNEKSENEKSWENKSDMIVWAKNLKKKKDEKMKKWCDFTNEKSEIENDEKEKKFEKKTYIMNYSFNWYNC